MYEKITLEELPFTFDLLETMKNDGLTIERLKGEIHDYYYLTSRKLHRVYSLHNENPILLTEIHLYDLMKALDNDRFRMSVLNYMMD